MWHLRNQPLATSLFRLSERRGGLEILMRSEEAQIGKRMRLRTDYRQEMGKPCLQVKGWLTGRRSQA
jgi:hypothetical protein